jgi:hypothetical protein
MGRGRRIAGTDGGWARPGWHPRFRTRIKIWPSRLVRPSPSPDVVLRCLSAREQHSTWMSPLLIESHDLADCVLRVHSKAKNAF